MNELWSIDMYVDKLLGRHNLLLLVNFLIHLFKQRITFRRIWLKKNVKIMHIRIYLQINSSETEVFAFA